MLRLSEVYSCCLAQIKYKYRITGLNRRTEIAQYFQFHLATQRIPLHLVGKRNVKTTVHFQTRNNLIFLERLQNFEKHLLPWSCQSVCGTTRFPLDRFA